jgi:putative transposase
MSEKYLNKYRIPSTRLQNWDYGANGAYFITICTANRVQYFGKIENCQMHKTHADFAWQSLFHDHIIRNNAEFERIQNYIAKNPKNWKEDRFYE